MTESIAELVDRLETTGGIREDADLDRLIAAYREAMDAVGFYGDAMNYLAVSRYSDKAYACNIADDDGGRARAYFEKHGSMEKPTQ